MRLLFMGTPDFAVFSLRALQEAGHTVLGAVTQPDQPRGRGYVLTPPPVKVYAQAHEIPVYQPDTLRAPEFAALLEQLAPEVIVVAAYGKLLPPSVLEYPRYGCVNVHGSLLPEYRGAAPMQRAILDGKTETGITTMLMNAGLDTGDMLLTGKITIEPSDNFEAIHDKLGVCGAEVLLRTLERLEQGTLVPVPQDDSRATYAAKITKADCLLHFSQPAKRLHDQIRGLSPVPLAFTRLPDGKRLKVLEAAVSEIVPPSGTVAGTVLSVGDRITVACGEGALELLTILPEGKGKMSAAAFANGRGIRVGDLLGDGD